MLRVIAVMALVLVSVAMTFDVCAQNFHGAVSVVRCVDSGRGDCPSGGARILIDAKTESSVAGDNANVRNN